MRSIWAATVISLTVIMCFLIPTRIFAADFTASSLGDYGNVTVMEVSGNYDADNPDKTVNAVPRQVITNEFFKTHKDEYDFLVFFSNFDFAMPDDGKARGFYTTVKNDTHGLGIDQIDNTNLYNTTLNGSSGRLQGTIDMGNLSKLVSDPLDPKFEDTLGIFNHEIMHRWAARAKFKDLSNNSSSSLLGKDGSHWSFLLDSGGSLMYGNRWQDNGNGTFTSLVPQSEQKFYSPLDLYLMGMIDKSKVPPMLLIDSPGVDATQLPQAGVTITGTARTVTIDDIIADTTMGPRVPDAASAQKSFKTAFIYVTQPGSFNSDDLYQIESVRNGAVTRFSILTDGNAIMQVASTPKDDVPVNPGVLPPSTTPRTQSNINEGVQWLMVAQQADGSWVDLAQTMEHDTAETTLVLRSFATATQNYQKALQWLGSTQSVNLDYLTRKIQALFGAGQVVAPLVQELLSRQNTDGGWGSGETYESGNADTALVLLTLAATGYTDQAVLSRAINYLKAKQNTEGGWGSEDKGGMVQETSNVLSAFNKYRTTYQLNDAITNGTTWLVSKQNPDPDGGFGNSPSTVYDTAVATLALRELNVSTSITNKALEYIKGQQSENGSWNNSAYQTALAVNAIYKATVDPDLSITSDDITIIPDKIKSLPSNIVINVNISNLGQTAATAKVFLYDGSIADQNKIGEQAVSFPTTTFTTVTFSATAKDGSEHRFYVVVDPDNTVKESNELNNTAVKILTPEATYDLEVLQGDVTVTPGTADMLQDVKISAKISNKGTMTAYNAHVKYFIDESGVPFELATQTVDVPSGSSITNEITWRANKAGTNMRLVVQIDPYETELSETNNKAETTITVNADTRPNLAVSYKDMVITPSPGNERGTVTISALVKNDGFSPANNIVVRFYRDVPCSNTALAGTTGGSCSQALQLGTQQTILTLGPGENSRVSVDWADIAESGQKLIYVEAYTETAISEIVDTDNYAFVDTLTVRSLPDLAVSDNSIAFSPAAPKEGDTVAITVTVQNTGEQTASNMAVRLSEGSVALGNDQTIPSLVGGGTASVLFFYDPAVKGAHTFTAVVDPGNAITEQSKGNNSASRTLGVQDSSLWVTEQYISPNGDGVKDSTELFFRLEAAATVSIHIVNKKKETVRTFAGPELMNTTSGSIIWNGLNDSGIAVDDGEYQLQVLDSTGSLLAMLQVTVDNNRSPLTDAIETGNILNNNLSCMLPDIYVASIDYWRWFPDESGILFNINAAYNQNTPEFSAGIYTMAPDGQDILMVSSPAWSESRASNCTEQNPCKRSSYSNYKVSSDSRTIAVIITQETYTNIWFGSWYGWRWTWLRTLNQFWVMDRDGNNKVLIGSYDPSQTTILDFAWSPGNDYLVYRLDNAGTTEKLMIVQSDGTVDSAREIDSGGYFDFNYLKWSPDGREIAYIYGIYDDNFNYIQKARVSDLSGSKKEIYSLDAEVRSTDIETFEWLGSDKIVIGTYVYWQNHHPLMLVDKNGTENMIQLSDELIEVSVSPDRKHCAFTEYQDNPQKMVVKIADDKGNLSLVHEEANAFLFNEGFDPSVRGLAWSPDGRTLTAVDMAFGKEPACPAFDPAINLYEPHLLTFDLSSKVKKDFKISEPSCHLNYECVYSGNPACYVEKGPQFWGTVSFFKDNLQMLLQDQSGYFVFNTGTGSRSDYLPFQNEWYTSAKLSPLGGYLTYYQPVDQSSACYGRGDMDLWAISSLFNLTADLRTSKEKSAIILKGIAADFNFEGYQLEYADIKSPEVWSLVQPPSNVSVINDVFTTWVPPYEGSFYVRLTVWDKAGNTAVTKKRVSWGQYSSITNLYKSREIFSPNGDTKNGVNNTVELHYRVLESVHLEFNVYDAENKVVNTYYKDYAAPTKDFTEDFIEWNGTDQSHNTVPDGKYKIKVFDYEFFVEVDSTPPDANIELSPIIKTSEIIVSEFFSGEIVYKVLALGFAYDKNIKKWTVDYGEGDNPQEWHTLREGGTVLVKKDTEGNPLLKPLENDTIDKFAFTIATNNATGQITILNSIEYLVGRKYRITVEDLAGNKTTRISNMLEEKAFGLCSASQTFPGFVLETVKTPIRNLVLQSFNDKNDKWGDIETKSYPSNEDTVTIPYFKSRSKEKLRLKVVDIYGNEYISNEGGCNGDGGGVDDNGESELKLLLTVAYKDGRCDIDSGAGSAEIEAFVKPRDTITFKTLSYYIEKPSGTELLRQYDLASEKWGKVVTDTSALQERAYSVKAVLAYVASGQTAIVTSSVSGTLIVDHVLPTAQITYPTRSSMLCPVKNTDAKGEWYGLPIEGIATDNNSVQYYELYYGVGENPAVWLPAMTRINGTSAAIKEKKTVQGQLGVWDVTDLRGTAYSLKLKVVDVAGNVSCYTTSFSIDTLTEITNLTIDKKLISPNVGGNANVGYQIDEYATVAVKVFKLIQKTDGSYGLDAAPIRNITAAKEHLGGSDSTAWDGKPDGGTTASDGKDDGKYGIVVYATDSCGNKAQKWVVVEVDTIPPTLAITYPGAGSTVGNLIVEVKGTADDPHFQSYSLERGQEEVSPTEWTEISSGTLIVKDSILGKWNTSGLTGSWTLRLTATDSVGNKSEIKVPVTLVAPTALIKKFDVTPGLISPNKDGKLETTDIKYEIGDAADIKIEVADSSKIVKHTHIAAISSAGTYMYSYGGQSDPSGVLLDGIYTVSLIATSSTTSQREAITFTVDTTLPTVDMTSPKDKSFLAVTDLAVIGTVSDSNMAEYSLSYAGAAGSTQIDQGSQSRAGYTFGLLNTISEGDYILTVRAKDLGENEINKTTAFTIDRTPPVVKLDTPKNGAYYGGTLSALSSQPSASITITGSLVEKNLDTFSLRFGLGDAPAEWIELVTGTTVTAYPSSYVWNAGNSSDKDGVYTLSLFAKDKAGLIAEQKVKITIDNTVPTSAITSLHDGDYVNKAVEVKGTAYDLNFDKYVVEISEGQCSDAFKWAVIKTGTTAVQNNVLTTWQALPLDGDYCLRVTTTDKVGLTSEAKVNVKVDTHPPAAPVLSGRVDTKTNARLDWTNNMEPDLAGYNLYKAGQKLNSAPTASITYLDQNLTEGVYAYTVKAVDLAGNESSASNEVKLKIDLTGPDARIRSPHDNGTISGLIDIKGTVYSADDFKQYRVSIGQGASPSSWTIIRTSPLPTSYGVLAQWDTFALAEGQVSSIKLEAEDLSGNITTHQISVTIDNTAPAAPNLISAATVTNSADVALTWLPNTETDLAGYLLYRNNQLANVSGIVVGDLKPYLISAATTTYLDKSLPDGMYTYYLTAMDQAGNISPLSVLKEVMIETRAPCAAIVDPLGNAVFEKKIMVKAESPDLDIASVQFQYQSILSLPTKTTDWISLGSPVTTTPSITYMDPSTLGPGFTHGDYRLRAVATDKGQNTDTAPGFITITYADLTPPAAQTGLSVLVNGDTTNLIWTPNTDADSDLAGYNVYRTAEGMRVMVNTALVAAMPLPTFPDSGLADGSYAYDVTAVDTHGNESKPSNNATAIVYTPVMTQPYTPVGQGTIQVSGKNVAANASVSLFAATDSGLISLGTATADAAGVFTANAALTLGENRITAHATDSAGNISKDSVVVIVIYNDTPGVPSGLTAPVQDHDVHLAWNPNPEADILGYNLYRDGVKLNIADTVSPLDVTASSSFDLYNIYPWAAMDNDQNTYWMPQDGTSAAYPAWWEMDLATPELISHMEIHWGTDFDSSGNEVTYAGKDFEIQVWSADANAWITQAKVAGNAVKNNVFDFNPAYRTDKIRIFITDSTDINSAKQVRLAEVTILKDTVVQTTPPSYDDLNLLNKQYGYTVTAVDNYGFEGPATDTENAIVGDIIAPQVQLSLSAAVVNSNVTLLWQSDPSDDPDVAGYQIYRYAGQEWTRITTSPVLGTQYVDANLMNGTYSYRVTAVDSVGNESSPSNDHGVTVYVAPPDKSASLTVSTTPEGGLNATWIYDGSPAGFNIYRSLTVGGPYTKLNNVLINGYSYLDTGVTIGVTYYYVVAAADLAGNVGLFSNEAFGTPLDTVAPAKPVILLPTVAGETITLFAGKANVSGTADPDAFVDLFQNGTFVGRTATQLGELIQKWPIDHDGNVAALSPDGNTLAYTLNDYVWLKSLVTGAVTQVFQVNECYTLVWSPDGTKIAYTYYDNKGYMNIGLYDVLSSSNTPLANDPDCHKYSPSWSSDGTLLSFVQWEGTSPGVRIIDISTGTITQVITSSVVNDAKLSPDGKLIAYYNSQGLFLFDLVNNATRQVDSNYVEYLEWSYDGSRLAVVSYRSGLWAVYVLNIADGTQTLVPGSSSNPYYIAWTADDQSVVFALWDDLNSRDTLWMADVQEHTAARQIMSDLQSIWSVGSTRGGAVLFVNQEAQGNFMAYTMKSRIGSFAFDNVALVPGENIFTAVSSDAAGNSSAASDAISVVFDTSTSPDLSTSSDDVYLYPPYPIAGERMSINAVISNAGQGDAVDVNADLYVWNALGQLQLLKSERFPLIAAGSAALLTAEWDSTGMVGDNRLVVVVDSEDKIAESNEANNMAIKDFYVADHIGMSMTTALDATQHSSQNANISVTIRNTGPAANAVLDVRIEDADGYTVSLFDCQTLNLAYAKEATQNYVWNTGSTYAGPYGVHSILKDAAGTMLAENTTPFTIVSDAVAELTVVTDKAAYAPNENVVTSFMIKNTGKNYIIPLLQATVSITDALGTVLFNEIKTASNLLPGSSVDLSSLWNIGLTMPGDYIAVVQVSFDGGATVTTSAVFKINTLIVLSGAITASPSVVPLGNTTQVTYTLANTGNADALGYTTRISILDPETQTVMQTYDELVDIGKNSSKSGQIFVSTNGYGLKTYTAVLQALSQTGTKTIGSASFTVKDLTPPVVTILSPMEGNSYGSTITILTSVTDNASGVDQVEYKRDSGTWSLLPVSDPARGRFGATWDPTMDDNGMHSISFRATDKAGNVSEPVTVNYEVQINRAPTAPSPAAPADGADVGTALPELVVNNASDPNNDPLTYAFEVYADSDLTVLVTPPAGGIAEGTGTTSWQVTQELTENAMYYWRARAFDGKLYGDWMNTAAFRVNSIEDPPSAPVPTSPADGTEVATRTPMLTVINAVDPDSASLTYNFQIALDPAFVTIVTSTLGVFAGQGTTSWQVPVQLEEDRLYYWRAQADDWTVSGPWSVPVSFFVNTGNNAPTVPVVIAPANNAEVATTSPDIELQNSIDPDSTVITYSIELDTVRTFDSPNVRRITSLPQGQGTTLWHVDGLSDNTLYYVRAKASDGAAESDWSGVPSFFVNTVNDAPEKPVPANPSDGAGVNVFTPTLSVQNATDLDGDILTYDFKVYEDAAMSLLAASVTGVIETQGTTSWTLSVPLKENRTYYWQAQAFDGELASGWTAPLSFTVNTGDDEPTAPTIVFPAEGGSVDIAKPLLTVLNATDPDSSRLTYEFQVFYGSAMIWSASGVAEGSGRTSTTLTVPLTDNTAYSWRCRANDGQRDGAWTAMTKFTVHLPQTGITVDIEFEPETLNQKSKGDWVMVEIELPHGYRASDVDISSIRLEGTIPAVAWPRENNKHHHEHGCEHEHGEHDHSELKVKFRRSEAIAVLPAGNHVPVHVTGTVAGTTFEGVDIIRVIH